MMCMGTVTEEVRYTIANCVTIRFILLCIAAKRY